MNVNNYPTICRLCCAESSNFVIVGNYVYGGTDNQKFYECPNCDIAFLYPPLTPEEEQYFYTKEYEKFMENRSGKTSDWGGPKSHITANESEVTRRLPYIEKEISNTDLQLLELGCSSGFMLFPLQERGLKVYGVEPSGLFKAYVQSRSIQVYDSIDQFEMESGVSGELDLITHYFLLEHVRDPLQFLKQCLRQLKPNGKIFFEVPSRDDPLVSIYNIPDFHKFYWSVAHNWYFNHASLTYLLDQLKCSYVLIPEQRYDLSNHMWWGAMGQPGGMGKFSASFTNELDEMYKQSMRDTGHCDTYFVWINKEGSN
jgi:SAM-dependent methyltransferase